MDFFKKSCKELCTKLIDESITTKEGVNNFVSEKCNKYNKTKRQKNIVPSNEIELDNFAEEKHTEEDIVVTNEKKLIESIYEALELKANTIGKNYNYIKFKMTTESNEINDNDIKNMAFYIKYLVKMKAALADLARPMKVKFFSIFLGVGTGKYYKEAAKKLEERIRNCTELISMIISKKKIVELIIKLSNKKITNKSQLDDYINKSLMDIKEPAKEIFKPVYDAFEFKEKNRRPHLSLSVQLEYFQKMKEALTKLSRIKIKIGNITINLNLSKDENYNKAIQEISEKIRKLVSGDLAPFRGDPGLFKGLPNGDCYCYLNTALQELYSKSDFRYKVLNSDPPEPPYPPEEEGYKELFATKFFFEYLTGKIKEKDFKAKRKKMAKWLGYVKNTMGNSATTLVFIERNCLEQLRKLKNEPQLDIDDVTEQEQVEYSEKYTSKFNPTLGNDISLLTTAMRLFKLYEDPSLNRQILQIKKEDFFLKNAYETLEPIWKIFNKIKDNQFDSKLINLLQDQNKKEWSSIRAINRQLQEELTELNSAKKSQSLYSSSSISIDNPEKTVRLSIIKSIKSKVKKGLQFYLALQEKKFSVRFSDRTDLNPAPRRDFSVEETLDLSNLIRFKALKIFVDGEELLKRKYEFKLVSVSIGTGDHYYLYRKVGDTWKEFNDSQVTNRTWKEIKDDINGRCETLTYELK